MFKNISIKHKLMGITGALICIYGLTLVLTLYLVSNIKNEFSHFKESAYKGEVYTLSINKELNYVSRVTRDIMLGGEYAKNMDKLKESEAKITKYFEELLKVTDEKNKPIVKEAELKTLNFTKTAISVLSKLNGTENREQLNETYQEYKKVATPPADDARESFSKVIKLQEEVAKDSEISIHSSMASTQTVTASTFVLVFFVGFLPLIMLSRYIIFKTEGIEHKVRETAQTKDLNAKLDVGNMDEIGKVATDFNHLISAFRETVSSAKNTSAENADVASELSSASHSIGDRVSEQTKLTQVCVEDGLGLKKILESSTKEAQATVEEIESANKKLTVAAEGMQLMVQKVSQSVEIENKLSQKLSALSVETEKIKEVLSVIGDIADQTNLLALNAAIEAARAGDAGRGFAVVADEVRKLAEKTQKSLVEIDATVASIVGAVADVSQEMEANAESIKTLIGSSKAIEGAVTEIIGTAQLLSEYAGNSASIAEVSRQKIGFVTETMRQINILSDSKTTDIDGIAAVAGHIAETTVALKSKLDEFRV